MKRNSFVYYLMECDYMETIAIKIPKQLMDSVKAVVDKTRLFADEEDFISQAIIKQISKYK